MEQQNHIYSVKNVKSFEGRQGYGFNASLYRDGKRVARVLDEANGGCYHFDWTSKDEQGTFIDYVHEHHNDGLAEPEDMFVANLVDAYETAQHRKRQAKKLLKSCCFYVPSQNTIKTFKNAWRPAIEPTIRKHLEKSHPGDHVLLNTLPIDQVTGYLEKIERKTQ